MPVRIRISFDRRDEMEEAKKVLDEIVSVLRKHYRVSVNRKIYWNLRDKKKGKEDYGGRIYITLRPKGQDDE